MLTQELRENALTCDTGIHNNITAHDEHAETCRTSSDDTRAFLVDGSVTFKKSLFCFYGFLILCILHEVNSGNSSSSFVLTG